MKCVQVSKRKNKFALLLKFQKVTHSNTFVYSYMKAFVKVVHVSVYTSFSSRGEGGMDDDVLDRNC